MDFPIVDLLDDEMSTAWVLKYFHPRGLRCPHCTARVERARIFRAGKRNKLCVYRCERCQGVYTAYSGTVFEGKHLQPAQVIMLLRGVCKGEPSLTLAREIHLSRRTVHDLRQVLQANAEHAQPRGRLTDPRTETDELFQNAGEKRRKTR